MVTKTPFSSVSFFFFNRNMCSCKSISRYFDVKLCLRIYIMESRNVLVLTVPLFYYMYFKNTFKKFWPVQDSGTKYCGSVETSVVYKQICLFSAWKKKHDNYFFSLKKIKNYLMSLFNIVYVVGKIVKWQKRQVKYS